eukprot:Gb_02288 [translate_table: standard]
MAEPPPFQEATRCDVCKCSFNAFRRRHHCRCCGRTLCNEHSSKQIELPQFGIHSAVRVCYDCFNRSTESSSANTQTTSNDIDAAANTFSRFDLNDDSILPSESQNSSSVGENSSVSQALECKCGMPLCICEAPSPPQVQPIVASTSNYHRPKKVVPVQHISSDANSKPSTSSSGNNRASVFFASGQTNNGSMDQQSKDYETSGEGLREAIKNGDVSAVKELLKHGVNANYCDKQGMSLLHLATVFNFTEIAFILMDAGASVDAKNAQGETPLDCAQTMLQYKMRQKMQETANI